MTHGEHRFAIDKLPYVAHDATHGAHPDVAPFGELSNDGRVDVHPRIRVDAPPLPEGPLLRDRSKDHGRRRADQRVERHGDGDRRLGLAHRKHAVKTKRRERRECGKKEY
jgi:hypothetical protein